MSGYGVLVIILIFVGGLVALMCGIIGNNIEQNNRRSMSKRTRELIERLEAKEREEDEEFYDVLWSEGGDMDDSF